MAEPKVCCLCLAPGRPDYVDRVRRCFSAQNYDNATLLVLDTSLPEFKNRTIGVLRNIAIAAVDAADLISHWDYDDWSDSGRLTQQVYFQKLTERPVVGYYDMPILDTQKDQVFWYDSKMRNYALGTSLLYKREIWEKHPFPDMTPEDTQWQHSIGPQNIAAISSIRAGKPMMIQQIHGANAAAAGSSQMFEPASADLDAEVRRIWKNA